MMRKLIVTDDSGVIGQYVYDTDKTDDSSALHFFLCEAYPSDTYSVKFENCKAQSLGFTYAPVTL